MDDLTHVPLPGAAPAKRKARRRQLTLAETVRVIDLLRRDATAAARGTAEDYRPVAAKVVGRDVTAQTLKRLAKVAGVAFRRQPAKPRQEVSARQAAEHLAGRMADIESRLEEALDTLARLSDIVMRKAPTATAVPRALAGAAG